MTGHVINGLRRVAGTFLKKKAPDCQVTRFAPLAGLSVVGPWFILWAAASARSFVEQQPGRADVNVFMFIGLTLFWAWIERWATVGGQVVNSDVYCERRCVGEERVSGYEVADEPMRVGPVVTWRFTATRLWHNFCAADVRRGAGCHWSADLRFAEERCVCMSEPRVLSSRKGRWCSVSTFFLQGKVADFSSIRASCFFLFFWLASRTLIR